MTPKRMACKLLFSAIELCMRHIVLSLCGSFFFSPRILIFPLYSFSPFFLFLSLSPSTYSFYFPLPSLFSLSISFFFASLFFIFLFQAVA